MYSPSRKVRASIRRTISLIIISCMSCIVLVGTIVEFGIRTEEQLQPTQSAGSMLNRSQMVLAKEVILEPSLFPCQFRRNNFGNYPLYIIVKTRAVISGNYFQRRMFTRTSWGREARLLGIPVIYAIGRAQDERVQKKLEHEHRIYDDILQFNYIDAYYNISIKTVGILHWFHSRNCHQKSPYLFIVDDDVLINIPSLMKMIAKETFQSNTLYGLYLKDIEPHPSGKWAVSLEDYPNRTYPEFITGASTLYPSLSISKIVRELFQMIDRNQPIFFLDDVLITGILAEQLNIQRAPLVEIEDCSYTDLLSRTIISECKNIRRIYVWSKFVLSRIGQNTFNIDRLIQTTAYVKWRGDFKQTRNGTAIIHSSDSMNIFVNSIRTFIASSYARILMVMLCMVTLVVGVIFIRKILCLRQSSYHHAMSSKPTSTILFPAVKQNEYYSL